MISLQPGLRVRNAIPPSASAAPASQPRHQGRDGRLRRRRDHAMVSRPFPSWNRSILTEIYLCHACSCHEIEDGNGRAGLWSSRRRRRHRHRSRHSRLPWPALSAQGQGQGCAGATRPSRRPTVWGAWSLAHAPPPRSSTARTTAASSAPPLGSASICHLPGLWAPGNVATTSRISVSW
jgi:hypothetical protein